jgi:small subunit ribosomal protein S13
MAEEIRYMVRMAGKDLDGKKPVRHALVRVNGVGPSMANAIVRVLNLDPNKQIGTLPDSDIKKIEDFLQNPLKFNIPGWIINRKKDWVTGKDMHLVSAELEFANRKDVDRLKLIKSRRGMRHAMGLKLRGQRTKSTGRKGRSMGVRRKKGAKKGKV